MRGTCLYSCIRVLLLAALAASCGEGAPELSMPPGGGQGPAGLTPDAPGTLSLRAISPAAGPQAGGILLSIQGTGFVAGTKVSVDGAQAVEVAVWSSTLITARLPPSSGGWRPVPVEVENPEGGRVQRADLFSYHANEFAFPQRFAELGVKTQKVLLADFNRDQYLDLLFVTSENAVDSVSVLLNDGQGGFLAPRKTPIPRFSEPKLADMNDDGVSDLILVSYLDSSTDAISIRFGDGQGGFLPPSTSVVQNVNYWWTGDFNGDKKTDILVYVASDSVLFFPGDGQGGIGAPRESKIRIDRYTQVADLNRDGMPDLLTPCGLDYKSLCAYLSDGTGGFRAPITTVVGEGPTNSVFGDWDGDGNVDVAVQGDRIVLPSGITDYNLLIFRADGTGAFSFVSRTTLTFNGFGASGDFNGDRRDDLILANRMFLSNGGGGFTNPSPTAEIGGYAADFNRDGKLDLLTVAADKARVLFGDGRGQFVTEPTAELSSGLGVRSAYLADINNDQRLDLVATDSGGVHVLPGDGTGRFGAEIYFGAGLSASAVGDAAGDGNQDILTLSSTELRVLTGDGKGAFTAGPPQPISGIGQTLWVDVNGDHKLDLVATRFGGLAVLFINDGQGRFSERSYVVFGTQPAAIAAGDWDQDGHLDLAISDRNSPHISLLRGDGRGGFGAATFFVTSEESTSLVAGDWDGDERYDLAVLRYVGDVPNPTWITLYFSDGHGGFRRGPQYRFDSVPTGIRVTDLNGDLKPDLLLTHSSVRGVSVLLGDGAGGFSAAGSFGAFWSAIRVAIGDLDSDHRPDLLLSSGVTPLLSILFNQSR